MKLPNFLTIIILLFPSACGALEFNIESAAPRLAAPASASSHLGATVVSTPSPAPLLPAPLYFISNGQIWRLEPDGQTLTQVTHEADLVSGMDVSPVDGTLAYISNNQLILVGTDGNERRVIVQGEPKPESPSFQWTITQSVSSPLWSPDGKQLAYGLKGVNILTLGTGQTVNLLTNSDSQMTYHPISWSPDGSRLLVDVGAYDGGGCALLSTAGGLPLTMPELGELVWSCGEASWSNDGRSVFLAESNNTFTSGIWQINADTGTVTTLLARDSHFPTTIAFPIQAPDGQLFFFYGQGESNRSETQLALYTMPLNDLTQLTPLRSEKLPTSFAALWAPDASLVIVSEKGKPMQLLRSDNGPAVKLPVSNGSNLRWGVKASD